jgi:hypothetical protein
MPEAKYIHVLQEIKHVGITESAKPKTKWAAWLISEVGESKGVDLMQTPRL